MKNFINIFRLSVVALVISLFTIMPVAAQNPPPPPPDHGGNTNSPAGGGAPIGEGILILSLLGAAYGVRKWRGAKNEQEV
ncbi:MAG: hypothetical protein WC271_15385 [Bacteroidales bacterium]